MSRLPSPAFWAKQRVFLTGHSGFKGSWLSLWLKQMGATVAGYSLAPTTEPSLFAVAGIGRLVDVSTIADVRDAEALRGRVAAFGPSIVLHLAAQPLVRLSYQQPAETYATNVMGTVHLLEAVRATGGIGAVLVVTSDKCYENRETITPYREGDPMGGHDPYSSSKGCAEIVAAAYARSYFLGTACGIATARAGNVVGGGDWSADRLIPDMARAFAAHAPAVIRRPDAVRPWQHVIEPLAGYLLAAEHIVGGGQRTVEAWNFGPSAGDSVPVSQIAQLAQETWGDDACVVDVPDPAGVHEATLLTLDATKAVDQLEWRPRWRLRQTIGETMSWYRNYYAGADAAELCIAQIDRYARAVPF